MIKFVVAAVWIVVAALGAVFYSFQTAQSKVADKPPSPFFGTLESIKTDVISIPLMANGRVYGYFLARLVYTVEPEQLKKLVLPAEALLIDQVYTYIYGNPQIDFCEEELDRPRQVPQQPARQHQQARRHGAHPRRDDRADRLPSKSEIRDNTLRRRAGEPPVPLKQGG